MLFKLKPSSTAAILSVAAVALTAGVLVATDGPRASAIINGAPVNASAYPFIASLTVKDATGKIQGYCSGTLVNQSWVLTAAHCLNHRIPKDGVTVILDTSDVADPAKATFVSVSQDYIIPPAYSPHGVDWDIALVKLAKPAPNTIPAVKLATQQDFTDLSQGYHLDLGYGDCVPNQKTVNTQLRGTAMSSQLTARDGLTFGDATSPFPEGVAGCPTLPSSPPPTPSFTSTVSSTASSTPVPSTPAQVPQPPNAAAMAAPSSGPCPTPAPPQARAGLNPPNAPAAPPVPSGTPRPKTAYPGPGDSGGPLLGVTCSGQWIELGVLDTTSSRSSTYAEVSDPQISSWLLFAEVDVTPIEVTPHSPLPSAQKGSPYSLTLSAQFGDPPYTWSLAGGQLPHGLKLSSDGTIAGTPTGIGTRNFVVRVTDRVGEFQDTSFTIDVT